jgi:hypothetical protein
MSRKEKIDLFLSKWVSRKLTVLAVASFGLFSGNLISSDWTILATMYVGIEGATSIVERIYKSQNNVN